MNSLAWHHLLSIFLDSAPVQAAWEVTLIFPALDVSWLGTYPAPCDIRSFYHLYFVLLKSTPQGALQFPFCALNVSVGI